MEKNKIAVWYLKLAKTIRKVNIHIDGGSANIYTPGCCCWEHKKPFRRPFGNKYVSKF